VVEKHFGGAICLFTNGAAGNINTVAVSTSFEDVQRIGERLGVAAVNGINNAKSESAMRNVFLSCLTEKIELQPRQCPSLQEAQAMVQREPSGKNRRLLRLAMKLSEGPMIAEVQGIGIGPVKIVTMPGEAFVETGLALKAAGAFSVVGYANGWLGYFPIRSAYDEGGYEVEPGAWSRVAPGSAEALQRAGENLLKKLDAQNTFQYSPSVQPCANL
jgi:hypothetical protein